MLKITENDYILAEWFAERKDQLNVSLMVMRNVDINGFVGELRLRYIEGNVYGDPFDGKDKKTVYTLEMPGESEDNALLKCHHVMESLKNEHSLENVHFVLIRGGAEKYFELIKDKHWVNMKEIPLSDVSKYTSP